MKATMKLFLSLGTLFILTLQSCQMEEPTPASETGVEHEPTNATTPPKKLI